MTRRPLPLCLLLLCLSLACPLLLAQTSPPLLPSGIAYDAQGDLFIADTVGNRILESSAAGILSVVAGTGEQGFAGDGGPATAALLNSPQGVAVAADGTLYIADTANQRIRAISPAGVISTLVSSGLSSPTALAITSSGTLLICDTANHRIQALSAGVITTLAGTGIQGFGGDGGPATAALLDTPEGVAIAPDGRIWIADSHNQRIRVVGLDGTISTAAGTGVAGYSGDGAPAPTAALSLPKGITVLPDRTVVFADSNNQRLRAIAANGVISTLVGGGIQGTASEAASAPTAQLNNPRGVSASPLGPAAYADSANRLARAMLANQSVYSAAGFVPGRASSVVLTAPSNTVYGTPTGSITVQGIATPQGGVSIVDGSKPIATGTLASGTAVIAMPTLAAGPHTLSAAYNGDGFNPASTSLPTAIVVTPVSVIATADAATVAYGQPIPPLSGSVAGLLSQDVGTTIATFTTTAGALFPVGVYSIVGTLTGPASGNYTLSQSPASGMLQITQAASSVALEPMVQSYAGMPWTLTALVSSSSGSPTGTVTFQDAGTSVATGKVVAGVASGVYLMPLAGSHSIVAIYSGDANFSASASMPAVATVQAMPDFNVKINGASTQTVQVGTIASYSIAVTSLGSTFSNPVVLSVSGLPAGVTPSFVPATVVPGSSGAVAVLSFPTTTLLAGSITPLPLLWFAALPFAACLYFRRRRRVVLFVCFGAAWLVSASGCGTRTVPDTASISKTLTLSVAGTGTNIAGVVVSHSTVVVLTVE